MCDKTFTDKKGIISNPNYPNYDKNSMCTATIKTTIGNLIKAYVIESSLDE